MGGPLGLPIFLCDGCLRFGGVKGVGRGIGDARGGTEVLGVAADSRSDAAVGVGAADELDLCHDARAIVVDRLEKKPGDGGGLGRRTLRDDLAFDGAAIEISPAGAGAVHSNFGSGWVVEGSVRGLKDPLRSVRNQLAFVDLNTFAGDRNDGSLAGWRVCGALTLSDCGDRNGCCEDQVETTESLHAKSLRFFDFSDLWFGAGLCVFGCLVMSNVKLAAIPSCEFG